MKMVTHDRPTEQSVTPVSAPLLPPSAPGAPRDRVVLRACREAELDVMLDAFGLGFLQYFGASITTALDDGRLLRLSRRGREAHLSVVGNRSAAWTFDDLHAAVTAWLTYDGTSEPEGGTRRT